MGNPKLIHPVLQNNPESVCAEVNAVIPVSVVYEYSDNMWEMEDLF